MRAAGYPCANYVPVQDAIDEQLPLLPPPKGKQRQVAASQQQLVARAEDKKSRGSWADKLPVSRCAKLLPGGDTKKNRDRVRHLMIRAGLTDLKTLSDETVLAVMRKAGYSTEGFEYAEKPSGAVVTVTQRGDEGRSDHERDLGEALQLIDRLRRDVMSYEVEFKKAVKEDRFPSLLPPLTWPLEWLGVIREFERRRSRNGQKRAEAMAPSN